MGDQPKISVIIPVHNGAKTIGRALASIEGQTYSDWEAIVVDDCSTDETHETRRSWAARDSRFRLVRLAENRASSGARNAALAIARGEFIAYLDDDDELYPDYLSRVAALLDKSDLLVFGRKRG